MTSAIVQAVLDAARREPDRAALTAGDLQVTYGQLRSRTFAVCEELSRPGAAADECIALLCGNSPEFAFGFLGARWAGKRVAVLPTLAPAPLLALLCKEAGATRALVSRDLLAKAREANLDALELESLAQAAPAISPNDSGRRRQPPDTVHQSPAVLLYTSGSTGKPKAVALSEENILSNIQGSIDAMRFTHNEVMLAILPLFHSYGLTVTLLLPLTLGARVVMEKFAPRTVLATIEKQRVTALIAVPSQYRLLAKDASPFDVSSLKYCIAGAERLPDSVGEEFEARFGKTILQGYGCTETSPVVAINPPWANRRGTVGPGLPNIRVTIRRVTQGEYWMELPTGEEGEICVEGPSVMLEYHNNPDATAAKIQRGVLSTGDRGSLDKDGYLHIAGRADDMLKVAGEKVYPAEVEQAIEQVAGVEEAAVVGVPDEARGYALVAYVQPKAGVTLTEAAIRSAVREHIEAIKVPRSFVVVEQLPRTPTGKLDKKSLAGR